MNQAVKDGIGQSGIAQDVVPVGYRQLTGHQGRAGLITLIEEFEQVAAAFAVEDGQPPVVEDQDIDPGQGCQGQRQVLDRLPAVFGREGSRAQRSKQERMAPLFAEIGRLRMEIDWLTQRSATLKRS